jgi:hypothetical protein
MDAEAEAVGLCTELGLGFEAETGERMGYSAPKKEDEKNEGKQGEKEARRLRNKMSVDDCSLDTRSTSFVERTLGGSRTRAASRTFTFKARPSDDRNSQFACIIASPYNSTAH